MKQRPFLGWFVSPAVLVALGLTAAMAATLLTGCVVASVVGTAASVTGSIISTTVDVTGSVISGAARTVTGGDDDDDN